MKKKRKKKKFISEYTRLYRESFVNKIKRLKEVNDNGGMW